MSDKATIADTSDEDPRGEARDSYEERIDELEKRIEDLESSIDSDDVYYENLSKQYDINLSDFIELVEDINNLNLGQEWTRYRAEEIFRNMFGASREEIDEVDGKYYYEYGDGREVERFVNLLSETTPSPFKNERYSFMKGDVRDGKLVIY